jgi:hypothetical protein
MPAAGVEGLLATEPAGVALLVRRVGDTERRIQLALQLARLFPGLDLAALGEFSAEVEWVSPAARCARFALALAPRRLCA